jgi:hypothetical protein
LNEIHQRFRSDFSSHSTLSYHAQPFSTLSIDLAYGISRRFRAAGFLFASSIEFMEND